MVRHHAQRVGLRQVLILDLLEVVRIGGVKPGDLHRRQAERLASGLEGDAVVDDVLVGQAGERGVLLPVGDEIAVDLVRQHDHAALETQLAKPHQVFRRPAVSGRILRVAEDQRVGLLGDPRLEVVEVQPVDPVVDNERTLFGERVGFPQIGVEAAVGGGREQHSAAGPRQRLERRDQRRVDPVRKRHQVGIDLQPVAVLVPVNDRREEVLRHLEVAPVLVVDAFRQGFGNRRSALEIHVGDSHRHLDVLRAVPLDDAVPLGAIGPDAVVRRVEVESAGSILHRRRHRRHGIEQRCSRCRRAGKRGRARTLQEHPAVQPNSF